MKQGASFSLYGVGPQKSGGECRETGQEAKACSQAPAFRKRGRKTHFGAHGKGYRGRGNKGKTALCSAFPPVPRRLLPTLPLPTHSQPAAASETGNTSGHQHQQHPGEQPVTVTAYREGQTSAKQTGKPERKSDDPKSPAGTSSECGTDRDSENKRHPQCEEKNDKRTVHAYLSGRSRTFEGKRKGSLLPGISRSYLGAPRRAPPHLYQGSLSFYDESPLLAKLRGGAVCRF